MILVTGGAGFIGSHFCRKLLKEKESVVVIDNLDPFYSPDIKKRNLSSLKGFKKFQFYQGDIRDALFLKELFSKHSFKAIVHLAARAGVRPSLLDPALYTSVNLDGTVNMLEMARKYNVNNFVFASSSSVYGAAKKVPFEETDNVDNPISVYAATKKGGELLCYTYHTLFGINISALRFFTVYGPGQRPDMAIAKFTKLIDEEKEVSIFGDGSAKRDFTYIDDIVKGIYAAYKKNKGYEILNLGGANTISVIELIGLLENALGKKAKIKYLPPQPGDVPITYASVVKAGKILGFAPEISIYDGIPLYAADYLKEKC